MIKTVKKGRPHKLSFDDKRNIVDWYVAIECNGDYALLMVHGVYTRMADFARNNKMLRGIPNVASAVDTDFSKDARIRAYIDQLIRDGHKGVNSKITESAFVALDVEAIVRRSPREQREALAQYNQYNQRVYLQASKAIEEHVNLCRRIENLQSTVNNLIAENQSLSSELNAAETENAALKHRIRLLNEIIDNTVTPTKRELIDQQSTEERLARAALFAVSDLSCLHVRAPADTTPSEESTDNDSAEDISDFPDDINSFIKEFGLDGGGMK